MWDNWERWALPMETGTWLNQYKHAFHNVDHHVKFDHSWSNGTSVRMDIRGKTEPLECPL